MSAYAVEDALARRNLELVPTQTVTLDAQFCRHENNDDNNGDDNSNNVNDINMTDINMTDINMTVLPINSLRCDTSTEPSSYEHYVAENSFGAWSFKRLFVMQNQRVRFKWHELRQLEDGYKIRNSTYNFILQPQPRLRFFAASRSL
jgi:hypothetical protein